MSLGSAALTRTFGPTAGWQQQTLCLPPGEAGSALYLSFEAMGPGGDCATAFATDGWVDDVSIGTDPSCPSQ
jgi:hypothetical protein